MPPKYEIISGPNKLLNFQYCYRLYERERATTSAIATVGRAISIEGAIKERNHFKKKIKSDNFTKSNREKSNIAFAKLEKL